MHVFPKQSNRTARVWATWEVSDLLFSKHLSGVETAISISCPIHIDFRNVTSQVHFSSPWEDDLLPGDPAAASAAAMFASCSDPLHCSYGDEPCAQQPASGLG